ncbi:hypothetical protein CFC21_034795 [Triticum aestivum]|uniref:F-box domain-containing protein n=2 Tax=Triticum aestivum TaxID=4565 RepID=A0A3B6KIF7_WHEAT|nr:hypothetical protein CFC21_034795 [Triticum aestivum]
MDLPDELVVDILGRLRPRDVAVCRCVRKDWRTAVDLHGLLLLPVGPVRGLFVNYIYKWRNGFFSRVAPAQGSPSIDGGLRFLPGRPTNYRGVLDHSNGLLLYENALEMHVLSLVEEIYRVIKTPRLHVAEYNEEDDDAKTFGYLGKSNNGVYYTAIRGYQFQVWILREASGLHQAPEWEVKHQANLKLAFVRHYNKHKIGENSATWVLNPRDKVSEDREEHEWDSSDDSEDSVADMEEEEINNLEGYKKHYHYYGLDLLGYHPHKEIALLGNSFKGFAYYLDNSKLEYLGSLFPRFSLDIRPRAPMFESFIYTPCMDDLLPAHNDI